MNRYDARAFLTTTRLCGASFSRDEKTLLISSDASGVFNAYDVSICDATVRQRTFSETGNIFAVTYLPDDNSLLVLRDGKSDERVHLCVSAKNGLQELIPDEEVETRFHGWSFDRRSFYCTAHRSGREYFDLLRVCANTFQQTLLCSLPVDLLFKGVSPDGKFVGLSEIKDSEHSDVLLYQLATGELSNLTTELGKAHFTFAAFDHRCRYVYYLTDLNSEFAFLERFELQTGKCELVEVAAGDISFVQFSRDGRYRLNGINHNAETKIQITEEATGKRIALQQAPRGEITGGTFSDGEERLAFYVEDDRTPNNLHICEVSSGRVRKLTHSLSEKIERADLVESREVVYRSFDGLKIPSLLWVPHRASRSNKMPALVWAHGGPGDQLRKGYHSLIQYLVNHDYVVLGVNFRGSRGYGKTFRSADDRKHGREPLWDCIEARKYLATFAYVEPSKIGIIGESYGGYMALAALAFHPEVFAVGVDMYGVSNWLQMLETLPSHSKAMADFLFTKIGNPRTDAEMLREISPLFQAHRINKPLLVLHGARDVGVPREQSDEMVASIERNHGIVEYLLFEDEGHGFTKKHNQIRAFEEILKFLDCYLLQNRNRSEATAFT